MESCARVMPLYPQYAEGEISSSDATRVSSHLLGCGACTMRVRGHRELLSALDRLPQVIPPSYFREKVMSRVSAAPLAIPGRRSGHLRVVKTLFWIALAGAGGSAAGAGAFLCGRDFAGKTVFFEPSFFAEWIGSLGRFALSLLLELATRSEIPSLLLSPLSPFAWGGLLTGLLLTALGAGALGVGVLATVRVLFGKADL